MATQEDYLVVYFTADRALQIVNRKKQTVRCIDEATSTVSVDYPTEEINEDGTVSIRDEPYEGSTVFSGSATSARAFMNFTKSEGINLTDEGVVETLLSLAKERKQSGKRGAATKLKRLLQASDEIQHHTSQPEQKKDRSDSIAGDHEYEKKSAKKKRKTCTPLPVKSKEPKLLDIIKLNEMSAFANVASEPESESEKSKTPPKATTFSRTERTPSKATPVGGTKKTPSKATPVGGTKKTPSKATPVGGTKKTPSKATPVGGTKKTPSKATPVGGTKKTPSKVTPVGGTKKTFTPPKATPVGRTEKTPSKATPVRGTKKTPSKATPIRDTQKTPSIKTSHTKTRLFDTCIRPRSETCTSEVTSVTITNSKTPSKKAYSTKKIELVLDSQQETSQAVFSGLSVLNDQDHNGFSYSEMPSVQSASGSENQYYGYNANYSWDNPKESQEDVQHEISSTPVYPVHMPMSQHCNPITDYFRELDNNQRVTLLGFLELLTLQLRQQGESNGREIFGNNQHSMNSPNTQVFDRNPRSSVKSAQKSEMRLVPLIIDPDDKDHFAEILVNPSQLRGIENKAGSMKNPALYLLNKVLDLVFSFEEMAASKGVSSLPINKREAIQEYLHTRCSALNFQELSQKKYITAIQNKIGNHRLSKRKSCK
ncbi:uncharacterized protein LOC117323146 [Pecten maximus]|uniref:uncharacterized protein LOC117323146 n=1 Tax=Pecten maximus TaxID=6579 RepID=UPI00145865C7|nr:uncharacterized protein LOC117323146 [Pecten maximus]